MLLKHSAQTTLYCRIWSERTDRSDSRDEQSAAESLNTGTVQKHESKPNLPVAVWCFRSSLVTQWRHGACSAWILWGLATQVTRKRTFWKRCSDYPLVRGSITETCSLSTSTVIFPLRINSFLFDILKKCSVLLWNERLVTAGSRFRNGIMGLWWLTGPLCRLWDARPFEELVAIRHNMAGTSIMWDKARRSCPASKYVRTCFTLVLYGSGSQLVLPFKPSQSSKWSTHKDVTADQTPFWIIQWWCSDWLSQAQWCQQDSLQ